MLIGALIGANCGANNKVQLRTSGEAKAFVGKITLKAECDANLSKALAYPSYGNAVKSLPI